MEIILPLLYHSMAVYEVRSDPTTKVTIGGEAEVTSNGY